MWGLSARGRLRACRRAGGWLIAALIPWGESAIARPHDDRPGFSQFKHTRWTADDGAPGSIFQVAQTPDGYLWLAAADGLYRFDGVTFERIAAPAGTPMERAMPLTLLVDRAGTLWVGYRSYGGLAVYRNGQLRDLRMPNPPRAIGGIAQTMDGAIWASSMLLHDRLVRLAGNGWQRMDERLRLTAGAIGEMLPTSSGGLYVSTAKGDGRPGRVSHFAPGARTFQNVPVRVGIRPSLGLDPTGGLWSADGLGARLLLERGGAPPLRPARYPPVPGINYAAPVFDPAGGLWSTTTGVGVYYIPAARTGHGAPPLRFTANNGLTTDDTFSSFVDREGSVWIGTALGLDQFRHARFVQDEAIRTGAPNGYVIAGSEEGDVYVGADRVLMRIAPGRLARPIWRFGPGPLAACPARGGGAWLVNRAWLVRVRGDRVEHLPANPGHDEPSSCTEDRHGRLWVNLLDDRVIWRDRIGWHLPTGTLGKATAWQMITDPTGDIAFTTPKDLAQLRGDHFSVKRLKRFGIGAPSLLAAGTRDVFVGGEGGLLRIRDGATATLGSRRFPWLRDLRDILQTRDGVTWAFGTSRLHQLRSADLDRAFADPHAPLPYRVIDVRDGLRSAAQQSGMVGAQMAEGGDGRIWLLNRAGAGFVNPAALRRNRVPPPVVVSALTSGGATYRDPRDLVLPPGTDTLDIAYTALSLVVPQRVRFRYRLEGIDRAWTDPGARRLASYANLGPGRYRFRVIAANDDGVWNRRGAALDITIRPTFLQSWPFRILCGIALVALLWLAYSMRVRAIAGQIRARMTERVEERERIARELHDTLLQSVQALTLRFQLAVDKLADNEPARPRLEHAIDQADQVIAEGRDRVRGLRIGQERDVAQLVRHIFASLDFGDDVEIAITSTGRPRPLDRLASDEIARIVGEAGFNIRRHAHAAHVAVAITHGRVLTLRFTDDGIGIAPEIAAAGAKAGHFGLPGMRERAQRLRGTLAVRRRPEGGTEVTLSVPAAIAYGPATQCFFARFWSAR